MLKSIIAVDKHDGTNRVLAMTFSIPNEKFNLLHAIRQTANDFCKSTNGCIYYGTNGSQLRWVQFCEHVPVPFQKKYGYELMTYHDMGDGTLIRNFSENLIHIESR